MLEGYLRSGYQRLCVDRVAAFSANYFSANFFTVLGLFFFGVFIAMMLLSNYFLWLAALFTVLVLWAAVMRIYGFVVFVD
ncbi:MAG: hypothetical protein KAS93_06395 [Gammaproteobacteria bacterium]|nr:hypothetical protein [Gammaproteobacteria bacterium]